MSEECNHDQVRLLYDGLDKMVYECLECEALLDEDFEIIRETDGEILY